jgi:hypothetical protein
MEKEYIKIHVEYIKTNYWLDVEIPKDWEKLPQKELIKLKEYVRGFYEWLLALKRKIRETIND